MKQDLVLADLVFTVLAAVLCVAAVLLADSGASAPAKPPAQEIRSSAPVAQKGDETGTQRKDQEEVAP